MAGRHPIPVWGVEGSTAHLGLERHAMGPHTKSAMSIWVKICTRVTKWHIAGGTTTLDFNILHNTLSPCLMYTKIIFDMLGAHEVLGGVHGGGPP